MDALTESWVRSFLSPGLPAQTQAGGVNTADWAVTKSAPTSKSTATNPPWDSSSNHFATNFLPRERVDHAVVLGCQNTLLSRSVLERFLNLL
jgi:hypothetical protein